MPDSKEKQITARHQKKKELLPDIQNQLKSINIIISNINQLNLLFLIKKQLKSDKII